MNLMLWLYSFKRVAFYKNNLGTFIKPPFCGTEWNKKI